MSDKKWVRKWKREQSAFDRVVSISITLSEPKSASYVADEAHVSENTARNHLERLVDLCIIQKEEKRSGTLYYPDPLYTRYRSIRGVLDCHGNKEELIETKKELIKAKIELQDKIAITDETLPRPDEIRDMAAETENIEETRELMKTASDLELIQYKLYIINETIKHYDKFTQQSDYHIQLS